MNILIIEDEMLIAQGLMRSLKDYFSSRIKHLDHCDQLDDAIEKIQTQDIDLVLLDLNLPDGNGLELIEEIHQLCPGLPIVVLSSTELSTEQLSRVEAALAKSRTETQDFLDILARLLPTKENGYA